MDAFSKAITPKTRVMAFTHVTSSAGDLYPARELCRLARERGVLTVVDGAQSFGVLDIDLSDMQPDFFTGSAHKWPCGPRECGVLYVNKRVESRYLAERHQPVRGRCRISKPYGGLGQRDEAAMIGFGEAIGSQTKIGRRAIQDRSRELAAALIDGASGGVDGVTVCGPTPIRLATPPS